MIVVKRQEINKHHDFHVRRDKVFTALRFLKLNNPFYANIMIDEQRISEFPAKKNFINHLLILAIDIPKIVEDAKQADAIYKSTIPQNV